MKIYFFTCEKSRKILLRRNTYPSAGSDRVAWYFTVCSERGKTGGKFASGVLSISDGRDEHVPKFQLQVGQLVAHFFSIEFSFFYHLRDQISVIIDSLKQI